MCLCMYNKDLIDQMYYKAGTAREVFLCIHGHSDSVLYELYFRNYNCYTFKAFDERSAKT